MDDRTAPEVPDVATQVVGQRDDRGSARHHPADRIGVPLAAAALQFPLGHPQVAAVIPGAFKPEHVSRNVATFRTDIPADLWAELKHEGLLHLEAPVPG